MEIEYALAGIVLVLVPFVSHLGQRVRRLQTQLEELEAELHEFAMRS